MDTALAIKRCVASTRECHVFRALLRGSAGSTVLKRPVKSGPTMLDCFEGSSAPLVVHQQRRHPCGFRVRSDAQCWFCQKSQGEKGRTINPAAMKHDGMAKAEQGNRGREWGPLAGKRGSAAILKLRPPETPRSRPPRPTTINHQASPPH